MEVEQSLGASLHTEADSSACSLFMLGEGARERVGSHNPSPPQSSHIHKTLSIGNRSQRAVVIHQFGAKPVNLPPFLAPFSPSFLQVLLSALHPHTPHPVIFFNCLFALAWHIASCIWKGSRLYFEYLNAQTAVKQDAWNS